MGANVLLQAGGGCRYRYYAEVQETILKDLGYNFEFIQIIGGDSLNFKEVFAIFKKLNPTLTKREFIHEGISALLYINYLDKLDIEMHSSLEKFLNKYKPEENNMYFSTTKGKHCYSDVDYSNLEEVFILFGKETKGLPEDLLQKYITNTIRIPMREHLRSLNLSNSVAIVAYEICRQVGFDNLEQISKYFD